MPARLASGAIAAAPWAAKLVRPARREQVLPARVLGRKALLELQDRPRVRGPCHPAKLGHAPDGANRIRISSIVAPGNARRIFGGVTEEIHAEQVAGSSKDLGQVIESARSMVGEQFQIAERLDRKARYQAATAGAFFAVVQAVAINAITGADISTEWIGTLAAFAIPGGLMTIASVLAAADAWRTQLEKDLPIPDLRAMVDGISLGDENALRELAHHYLNLAEKRRAGNATQSNE